MRWRARRLGAGERGGDHPAACSRLTCFLRACADRFVITDEPTLSPPKRRRLYLRWLRAVPPGDLAAFAKARQSQAQPVRGGRAAAEQETVVSLTSALAQPAAALLRRPVSTLTRGPLVRVCRSWDAALRNRRPCAMGRCAR